MEENKIRAIIEQVRNDIHRGAEGLRFDAGPHKYYYNGRELKCVSEVCELFEPGFDQEYWAKRKADEMGCSVEDVKKKWNKISRKACDEGTEIHSYGEYKFYASAGLQIEDPVLQDIQERIQAGTFQFEPRTDAVDDAWEWLEDESEGERYYPVAAENRIIYPELGYAGTFDLLFLCVKANGEYGLMIFDYKTNNNLFNIFKDRVKGLVKMNRPLEQMANCNAAHYSCQLSLYQMGLERVTDVPIIGRRLLWVYPDGSEAINSNSRDGYLKAHRKEEIRGKKSKWKFMQYSINEIRDLKREYQFRRIGRFGMLELPYLGAEIKEALISGDR